MPSPPRLSRQKPQRRQWLVSSVLGTESTVNGPGTLCQFGGFPPLSHTRTRLNIQIFQGLQRETNHIQVFIKVFLTTSSTFPVSKIGQGVVKRFWPFAEP